jgi:hypothetical protein
MTENTVDEARARLIAMDNWLKDSEFCVPTAHSCQLLLQMDSFHESIVQDITRLVSLALRNIAKHEEMRQEMLGQIYWLNTTTELDQLAHSQYFIALSDKMMSSGKRAITRWLDATVIYNRERMVLARNAYVSQQDSTVKVRDYANAQLNLDEAMSRRLAWRYEQQNERLRGT